MSRNIFRNFFRRVPPGYMVIMSYLTVALSGTVLLLLPLSSLKEPLSFVDALFTATSAVCVTGLIVVDTGAQFTGFGKTVIMILIQLGGLGVMTFSVMLFLFLRVGFGTKQRWIVMESFTTTPIPNFRSLIKLIFIFTLLIETVGTIILFIFWRERMPGGTAFFTALFHSISAFCNAGFSFFSSSFIQYRHSTLINITVMALIVVGGLGFPVIYELFMRFRYRKRRGHSAFSLHSRMVVFTTLILIITGALVIFMFERSNQMTGLKWSERIFSSFFQSVTARTAGFNTLDISSLGPATLYFLIMLMFVGASPGSCGGGIKTTSLAVLVAILKSKLEGMKHVSVFRRTIPEDTVSRTLAIFIMAVMVVSAGLIVLLAVESSGPTSGGTGFLSYLFEAVSAFGTVGLTMGVTPNLSVAGKVIIIILMLLGRVGLLTVAYVVTQRETVKLYRYAEEKVMIG
jgi:trk system potassium uptake protein TrkH